MKKVILAVALATFAGVTFANDATIGDTYNDRVDQSVETTDQNSAVQGSLNSNSGNSNSNNLEVNGGQTTYNGNVQNYRQSRNTPSMAAPMATSGIDTCVVGMSGSASGPGFGISYGKGKNDRNCERIKLAKAMQSIGLKDAAVALLAQDDRVANAIRLAYPDLAKRIIKEDAELAAYEAEREAHIEEVREWERAYEEDYWNTVATLRTIDQTN